MVGLPSETHLNFYQVDIEDFDNEVYSYEVEARNDEEAALKAEDTRQVRDVCIFRINGMEVFLWYQDFLFLHMCDLPSIFFEFIIN